MKFMKFKKDKAVPKEVEQPAQEGMDAGADLEPNASTLSLKSIALVGGGILIFLIIIIIAVMSKGQRPAVKQASASENTQEEQTSNVAPAKLPSFGSLSDGIVNEPVKEENEPNGKTEAKTEPQGEVHGQGNVNSSPKPNQNPNPNPNGNGNSNGNANNMLTQEEQQTLKRIRQLRQQAFENALKSSINTAVKTPVMGDSDPGLMASAASAEGRSARARAIDNERARLDQRLREIRSNTGTRMISGVQGNTSFAPSGVDQSVSPNVGVSANDPYAQMASSGKWDLGSSLEAPIGDPYLVRAGTVIPATLISGINSDLPGQIIGQVSQNVYDTAVGDHLLIPQGTRLLGTYNSGNIGYGQERVMIAWQRLIYPDGKVLDLGSMPGTDQGGYSGFADLVDNHWWELISGAFLMSGITAGVAVATEDEDDSSSDDNSDSNSINDELRQALATQFGNVIAQVIQRELNVSPTIEIRPGYKFNVMVTKDMHFASPYKAFDYRYHAE